ncbi:sensor histidine kinase [Rufibacter sp. LB8]|uniref:sensor histidine kinase n=1 Tax=Rufibacter sp. LB8 TaxID=2777781 RepID=UPI00178C3693|nr:histidine kinase [Rufibacter sp. LB8]
MDKKRILLFHCLFWFIDTVKDIIFGFQYYNFGEMQYTWYAFYKIAAVEIARTLLTASLFYLNAQLLVPRLFEKQRFGVYVAGVFGLWLAFTPVYYVFEVSLMRYFGWASYDEQVSFVFLFQSLVTSTLMYILLGIAYRYILDWFKAQEEKKELEKARMGTELAFLRSQINPHFLFNTINDIYALTYQKSDLAPDALLKLSGLLRYMLRESEQTLVPLSKELEYLQDVVELQRIGLKGHAYIDFSQEGDIDQYQIAPLLLIAFVENAFKHGICTNPARPIQIHAELAENQLHFSVFNHKNTDQKDHTGGIGLPNVKRRLELLYPQRHTLTIQDEKESFFATLTLQLDSASLSLKKPAPTRQTEPALLSF